MDSKRFELNKEDIKRWMFNTALFFAPAFLIFLTSIQAWNDWKTSLIAIYVWGLNTAIDITRKFLQDNKPI